MKDSFIKGIVTIVVIVLLYISSYFVFRFTHVITHYQGVEGSWFEPEGGLLELIYYPMIGLEIKHRGLRYDGGFR